jgi:hypothetical protein
LPLSRFPKVRQRLTNGMDTSRNGSTLLDVISYRIGVLVVLCAGCGDATGEAGNSAGTANVSAGGLNSAGSSASAAAGASAMGGNAATGGAVVVAAAGATSAGGAASGGQAGASVGGSVTAGSAGIGGAPVVGSAGASSTGSTIVPDPSWTCGKPEGIVDPTQGELIFRANLSVGAVRDVGATQYGKRRATDITGGAVAGGKLEASFLTGGLDYELTLSNGSIELEQVAMLKAKDGSLIYLRTCGVAPVGESLVRLVPDFEAASSSSVAWLNTGVFVGTRSLDAAGKKLELAIYDVSKVTANGPKLQLKDPTDAPNQPWDCAKASGSKGVEVFSEAVTLGGSLSVGASKRGTRNVIPITGGTLSGKLTGTIVGAGADYQLVGGATTLDARYVLASNDGEFVVVRNCGPFGALVPQFETRAAGPYAFLNTGKFISSDPGSTAGGVKITFYESK